MDTVIEPIGLDHDFIDSIDTFLLGRLPNVHRSHLRGSFSKPAAAVNTLLFLMHNGVSPDYVNLFYCQVVRLKFIIEQYNFEHLCLSDARLVYYDCMANQKRYPNEAQVLNLETYYFPFTCDSGEGGGGKSGDGDTPMLPPDSDPPIPCPYNGVVWGHRVLEQIEILGSNTGIYVLPDDLESFSVRVYIVDQLTHGGNVIRKAEHVTFTNCTFTRNDLDAYPTSSVWVLTNIDWTACHIEMCVEFGNCAIPDRKTCIKFCLSGNLHMHTIMPQTMSPNEEGGLPVFCGLNAVDLTNEFELQADPLRTVCCKVESAYDATKTFWEIRRCDEKEWSLLQNHPCIEDYHMLSVVSQPADPEYYCKFRMNLTCECRGNYQVSRVHYPDGRNLLLSENRLIANIQNGNHIGACIPAKFNLATDLPGYIAQIDDDSSQVVSFFGTPGVRPSIYGEIHVTEEVGVAANLDYFYFFCISTITDHEATAVLETNNMLCPNLNNSINGNLIETETSVVYYDRTIPVIPRFNNENWSGDLEDCEKVWEGFITETVADQIKFVLWRIPILPSLPTYLIMETEGLCGIRYLTGTKFVRSQREVVPDNPMDTCEPLSFVEKHTTYDGVRYAPLPYDYTLVGVTNGLDYKNTYPLESVLFTPIRSSVVPSIYAVEPPIPFTFAVDAVKKFSIGKMWTNSCTKILEYDPCTKELSNPQTITDVLYEGVSYFTSPNLVHNSLLPLGFITVQVVCSQGTFDFTFENVQLKYWNFQFKALLQPEIISTVFYNELVPIQPCFLRAKDNNGALLPNGSSPAGNIHTQLYAREHRWTMTTDTTGFGTFNDVKANNCCLGLYMAEPGDYTIQKNPVKLGNNYCMRVRIPYYIDPLWLNEPLKPPKVHLFYNGAFLPSNAAGLAAMSFGDLIIRDYPLGIARERIYDPHEAVINGDIGIDKLHGTGRNLVNIFDNIFEIGLPVTMNTGWNWIDVELDGECFSDYRRSCFIYRVDTSLPYGYHFETLNPRHTGDDMPFKVSNTGCCTTNDHILKTYGPVSPVNLRSGEELSVSYKEPIPRIGALQGRQDFVIDLDRVPNLIAHQKGLNPLFFPENKPLSATASHLKQGNDYCADSFGIASVASGWTLHGQRFPLNRSTGRYLLMNYKSLGIGVLIPNQLP